MVKICCNGGCLVGSSLQLMVEDRACSFFYCYCCQRELCALLVCVCVCVCVCEHVREGEEKDREREHMCVFA